MDLGRTQVDGARGPASRRPSKSEIDIGDRIGRYVVLARLGAGVMGVVYSAYDPQLDRRVALKLLNLRTRARSTAQARLLREARALARVDHPNVVTIYDVGLHAGQVFLAMQHITGRTLRDWLYSEPGRDYRATLAVFEGAARGLAAVHDAGMVHRDFKPDNVMLGDDGIVRVMDFGLANLDSQRSEASESGETDERDGPGDERVSGSSSGQDSGEDAPEGESSRHRLTRTGAVLGTPAYMAHEQFCGHDVTARSDQFGFCAALHEALYGVLPFPGNTYAELAASVALGHTIAAPRGSSVPPWLRALVLRGLARDPQARFESMHELLAALTAGDRRRRRVTALALVAALALGLGLAASFERWQASARELACAREGAAIDAVWHAEQRQRIEQAFRATGLDFASRAATYVNDELAEIAQAWRDAASTACRARTIERRWTEATYAKASWCLLDRRAELEALLVPLEQADPQLVSEISQALGEFNPPGDCIDDALLEAAPSPPQGQAREAIEPLRARAAEARSLFFARKFEPALERVQALERDAADIDWPPLQATLALDEAAIYDELEVYDEAQRGAHRAFGIAARIGNWDLATSAAIAVSTAARERGDYDEARQWLELAEIALAHASDPRGLLDIERREELGVLHLVQRNDAEGRALVEDVLAKRIAMYGPDHPAVADSLRELAGVEWLAGNLRAAERHARRGVEIRELNLGPQHPQLYSQLSMHANVLDDLHDNEAAMAVYARLFELERSRELDVSTGHVHNNYAVMQLRLGELEQATEHFEYALEVWEPRLGPAHPFTTMAAYNLATVLSRRGLLERAEQAMRRLLEPQATGADEPPDARERLAQLLIDELGPARHADARALLEAVIAARRAKLGPTSPQLFGPTLTLAELELASQARELGAAELLAQARALATGPGQLLRVRVGEVELALAEAREPRPELGELSEEIATLDEDALSVEARARLLLRVARLLARQPDAGADEAALARELARRALEAIERANYGLEAWRVEAEALSSAQALAPR